MSWCVFQKFQKTFLKTLEQSNAGGQIAWIKRLIAKTWDTTWHNSECIRNKLRIKKATLDIAIGNESKDCMLHAMLHFHRGDHQCFSAFIPAAWHQKVLPGDGRISSSFNYISTARLKRSTKSTLNLLIEDLEQIGTTVEYNDFGRFSILNSPMTIDMGLGSTAT